MNVPCNGARLPVASSPTSTPMASRWRRARRSSPKYGRSSMAVPFSSATFPVEHHYRRTPVNGGVVHESSEATPRRLETARRGWRVWHPRNSRGGVKAEAPKPPAKTAESSSAHVRSAAVSCRLVFVPINNRRVAVAAAPFLRRRKDAVPVVRVANVEIVTGARGAVVSDGYRRRRRGADLLLDLAYRGNARSQAIRARVANRGIDPNELDSRTSP
jgi:hypothetical protein